MIVRRDSVTRTRGTPLKNPRSWASLLLGAVALGTGSAWMLAADWGVTPLDASIAGAAERTGLTVGTVIIILSIVFLIGILLLRSRPGWGTLIAFVGVGVIVDVWNLLVFDLLGWSPAEWVTIARIGLWAVGFALLAFGVIGTLASDLGANPYDHITRSFHERFGWPLWDSRLTCDAVIPILAFLVGGAWGAGTVAILVLMPLALAVATPRVRTWVHASDAPQGHESDVQKRFRGLASTSTYSLTRTLGETLGIRPPNRMFLKRLAAAGTRARWHLSAGPWFVNRAVLGWPVEH